MHLSGFGDVVTWAIVSVVVVALWHYWPNIRGD